ncbi:MAG TPA: hypothetical protein VFE61_04045 [Candidatus Sulfotelmatobacter sp.]|jgi:hypothetical protein|nr:hypothetical protein [Candidatus Sulfotelmatobacter sp.]
MAGKPTERTKAERKFAKVIAVFSKDRAVTIGGGKGFGNGALKAEGKIFAMIAANNQFVVKLSKDRVNALVASGTGQRFEPRPGRPMKEWLVVTGKNSEWLQLAKEAREFVIGGNQ